MVASIDAPAKWQASGVDEDYGGDVFGLEHDIRVCLYVRACLCVCVCNLYNYKKIACIFHYLTNFPHNLPLTLALSPPGDYYRRTRSQVQING